MRFTDPDWIDSRRERAITEGLAMATYNPAIGRVLKRGGVLIFKRLAWLATRRLDSIRSRQDFERFHHRFVEITRSTIGKTSRRRAMSYGQAQKPVNVFLKVYVDWAERPNRLVARRLCHFLHVPLDSVLMYWVRKEHKELFEREVAPTYRSYGEWPSDLSLGVINRERYMAWQRFLRRVRSRRTIDLDIVWSLAPRD